MEFDHRENFTLLAQNGIIERQLYEQMSSLVSYRNRLAHAYGTITPDDLFFLRSTTGDIQSFVTMVRERAAGSGRA